MPRTWPSTTASGHPLSYGLKPSVQVESKWGGAVRGVLVQTCVHEKCVRDYVRIVDIMIALNNNKTHREQYNFEVAARLSRRADSHYNYWSALLSQVTGSEMTVSDCVWVVVVSSANLIPPPLPLSRFVLNRGRVLGSSRHVPTWVGPQDP